MSAASKQGVSSVIFGFFNERELGCLLDDAGLISSLSKSCNVFDIGGEKFMFVNRNVLLVRDAIPFEKLRGPFVIQVESEVWVKQEGKTVTLDMKNMSKNLSEDDFVGELGEENFGMELLIRGICSGAIGKFRNGPNLFDVDLDTKKDYDSWKLISYAMLKDDLLAAGYLSLFDWDFAACNEDESRPLEVAAQYASANTLAAVLGASPTAGEVTVRENVAAALDLGKTPLMIAAELGKPEFVRFLVGCGADVNHEDDDDVRRAVDFAWSGKHYATALILLEGDSRFPEGFGYEQLVEGGEDGGADKLKEFVDKRNKLHELVRDEKNAQLVGKQVSRLKSKLVFNSENKSLLSRTLETGRYRFDTFVLLKSLNFRFKDDDEETQCYHSLSLDNKYLLKSKMPESFHLIKKSHILKLLAVSKFTENVENPQAKLANVYETLDDIEELSQILRVTETSLLEAVLFDPNESASNSKTESGRICIGAKVIDADFFGTLIRELSRLTMTTVYKNQGAPYRPDDEEMRAEFNAIVEELKDKKEVDEIIKQVWKRDQTSWPAELIARVPQMTAKYWGEKKRAVLRKQAPDLLDFYDKSVATAYETFLKESAFIIER